KLYSLLAKIKKPEARIIAVFGACGERDRGKRPIIGEIVARYADFVIVTNDEP
ncbi:MAG TPA: UDP-N-acetylmuramoyl-L-alanyl-D-glutamate--2,6-diaminopimelate ligase, partial [Candidatus Moranbacteria bacterium]|nr:UDP-N-acetylmuramoyl-L-alanyl-D-glutamate--2,6-diaminopimelate ligase [Candidatus Moranbacteria bacterium]